MLVAGLGLGIALVGGALSVLTGAADDCPRYGAAAPYTLALELPTGRLTELGIGSGSVAVLGDGPGCDTS